MTYSRIPVTPLLSVSYDAYAPGVASVGKNVKAVRAALRLTQDEMAERCGVAQNQLSKWEKGRQEPTVESVLKIAVGAKVPIERLLAGVNRDFDLIWQSGDTQSGRPQGGPRNDAVAARVLDLQQRNEELTVALGKVEDVARQLLHIAAARVEDHEVAGQGPKARPRHRKTG
jgi:transcriptional regulator with XRE-family HTH domain